MLRPGRPQRFPRVSHHGILARRFSIALVLLALAATGEAHAQRASAEALRSFAPRLDHRFAPASVGGGASVASLPDTVRLLALMVDFQEDDDSRTSGTGKFGTIYEYDYGTEILDPLPHDRTYFQRHLRFLENYVRKSSGWKTILTGEVLDGVVTMPKPLGDYSFRKGESESPVAQLTVDAWALAAQQFPAFPFADDDMFVIFHAGRGRDVDLVSVQGFDPTPLDIPSLSFTMDAYRRLLGSSFDGVPMPDGARITNCSVIPTTNIREIPLIDGSTGLLEITINGLLAASFGTWAGLPDLFDTQTGKTGIGRFGLMDGEGIFAYGGIAPPEPSAWEKQQLGWTVAREAAPGRQNYILTSSDTLSTPDVLRVHITNREYWLLENRQRDRGGDGQLVTFVSGGQVQQVRFPKDTVGFENSNVQQLKGVIIDVEDYDWALPGGRIVVDDKEARVNGGILVWHVDENVIAAKLASNTVNTGDGPKGIDLEQAGGPQDIGKSIETVFGTETGTGSALDYWTRDNISPVYINRFDAYTFPNTRANSGAFTHVTMDSFSASGPIMTLDVALGDNTIAPAAGWPVDVSGYLPADQIRPVVQTADLDGDGQHELLAAYGRSSNLTFVAGIPGLAAPRDTVSLFAFRQDGMPFLAGSPHVFSDPLARFMYPPAIGDWDGDGVENIALVMQDSLRPSSVTSSARVWVLRARDDDGDGGFDVQQRFDFLGEDGAVLTPPAVVAGHLVFRVRGPQEDTVYVVTSEVKKFTLKHTRYPFPPAQGADASYSIVAMQGTQVLLTGDQLRLMDIESGAVTSPAIDGLPATYSTWHLPGDAAAGDIDGDGKREALVSDEYDMSVIGQDGDNPTTVDGGSGHAMDLTGLNHLALADADGDGRLDAVLSCDAQLRVLNYSLSSLDNYPAPYPVRFTLAADLGTGAGHALFGVGDDQVWQFTTRAKQADGFPIPIPTDADVVLFPSHEGKLALAVASTDGRLYIFQTGNSVTADQLIWRSRCRDEHNAFAVTQDFQAEAPIQEFFPLDRCYNWPNPVYDKLTYLRMYVAEAASATIKIYDLAGDKVDELHAQLVGGTDNDIPWDVSSIQSDTYLAHVSVTAGGKKGEKIIKIAVVK